MEISDYFPVWPLNAALGRICEIAECRNPAFTLWLKEIRLSLQPFLPLRSALSWVIALWNNPEGRRDSKDFETRRQTPYFALLALVLQGSKHRTPFPTIPPPHPIASCRQIPHTHATVLLSNKPEERRSHLLRGGGLISRILSLVRSHWH
jgi:hypothetical protein